jgi:hypothetical protein
VISKTSTSVVPMLGDQRIVASQDVWDQATEDDQEDVVVTQLVDEPQERQLSARPRVS